MMFSQTLKWLAPPHFPDDPEKDRTARLLHPLLLAATVGLVLVATGNTILTSLAEMLPILIGLIFLVAVMIISFIALYSGRVQVASILFLGAVWLTGLATTFFQGGMIGPDVFFSFTAAILAMLFLDEKKGTAFIGLTILAYTAMVSAERYGFLPPPQVQLSTTRYWIAATSTLIIAGILLRRSQYNTREAFEQVRKNEEELMVRNRELRDIQMNLEERVSERTAAVEARARQLQAVAEVGRAAATELELSELLVKVVRLISNRFGFYQSGIFLLDARGEYAVLRAASSPGGQEMLKAGHKLRVGEVGIVGYVTANRKPRIALDVGQDAVHFKNPYLPETRSEMALPLEVGGELLGALDVQSRQEAAFDAEDIQILQVLADQVAVAIKNARLMSETQAALESSRRAYGEMSRQAWRARLRDRPIGFQRTVRGLTPVMVVEDPPPETNSNGSRTGSEELDEEDSYGLDIPIRIRGNTIGFIHAQKSHDSGRWTPDEARLMETLIEQLGVALDSARLHEETQERAERERLTSDITARMRETLNIDLVLQTAAREMRKALDLAEVELRLSAPERKSQS